MPTGSYGNLRNLSIHRLRGRELLPTSTLVFLSCLAVQLLPLSPPARTCRIISFPGGTGPWSRPSGPWGHSPYNFSSHASRSFLSLRLVFNHALHAVIVPFMFISSVQSHILSFHLSDVSFPVSDQQLFLCWDVKSAGICRYRVLTWSL